MPNMTIQYKKYGDLLKMCMERQYSTYTMEQLGLIARTTSDGNQAIDKMMEFCKEAKTEKELFQKVQKLISK